ncbi:hypothetical protein JKP88DRAFT_306743 [Tribonema minus]|uniref:Hexosyltransferase n=1 Tax=Tribonema minus TaxID=303371 RepID=A0A835Z4X8_9STRA|nr:hypothetical protein JKP88DRAFT_306743 [Tribonema minus]
MIAERAGGPAIAYNRLQESTLQQTVTPYFDFVLTIFSGDSEQAAEKREQLRTSYSAYSKGLHVQDANGLSHDYTVKVLFLVSHPDAPEDGLLDGDVLYVRCPEGYRNIVLKTKAMLSVVAHFNFKYLMKSDDDTVVCLNKVAKRMAVLPPAVQDRVYAGVPTACGLEAHSDSGRIIRDPTHKWHDAKFVAHTLGGLDCYPAYHQSNFVAHTLGGLDCYLAHHQRQRGLRGGACGQSLLELKLAVHNSLDKYPAYHQGAFYLLSQPLVAHLHRGRAQLVAFANEDVTVGAWMMALNREMVALGSLSAAHLWDCTCATPTKWLRYDPNVFHHNCKALAQLQACAANLPAC